MIMVSKHQLIFNETRLKFDWIKGDGKLSHKEFIKVMKKRWMRGLETPKDTGFIKLIEALGTCTKEMIF